jgi:hypothetical protein
MALGNIYGAIDDFSAAIALKTKNIDTSYENRARADQYQAAIGDYSMTIGLRRRQTLLLIAVSQLRAMYPELKAISDRDLMEGLRQKYFPEMAPAVFAKQLLGNKPFQEFILADSYAERGDADLRSGNFRKAAIDYGRARVMWLKPAIASNRVV